MEGNVPSSVVHIRDGQTDSVNHQTAISSLITMTSRLGHGRRQIAQQKQAVVQRPHAIEAMPLAYNYVYYGYPPQFIQQQLHASQLHLNHRIATQQSPYDPVLPAPTHKDSYLIAPSNESSIQRVGPPPRNEGGHVQENVVYNFGIDPRTSFPLVYNPMYMQAPSSASMPGETSNMIRPHSTPNGPFISPHVLPSQNLSKVIAEKPATSEIKLVENYSNTDNTKKSARKLFTKDCANHQSAKNRIDQAVKSVAGANETKTKVKAQLITGNHDAKLLDLQRIDMNQ